MISQKQETHFLHGFPTADVTKRDRQECSARFVRGWSDAFRLKVALLIETRWHDGHDVCDASHPIRFPTFHHQAAAMPISANCPQCGKTYQVKDDFAGKKFRCKECQGVVSVPASQGASGDPWDNLQLDSFQDQEQDEDGFGAPAPPRRSSGGGKKKSKSRGGGGGMPVTVIVATACESILLLLRVLGVVGSIVIFDLCGIVIHLIGLALAGGAVFGYIQRINAIRWISVVLCGIGMLFCLSCGGLLAIVGVAGLEEAQIPQDQMDMIQGMFGVIVAIMLALVVFYGIILGCLVTRSAGEYFDR